MVFSTMSSITDHAAAALAAYDTDPQTRVARGLRAPSVFLRLPAHLVETSVATSKTINDSYRILRKGESDRKDILDRIRRALEAAAPNLSRNRSEKFKAIEEDLEIRISSYVKDGDIAGYDEENSSKMKCNPVPCGG
ncbi:hypothetical protein PRZ48_000002 [Zasmidium cellare]|uniref:Uncharacterized protein n=1 Tax=Zasmidium cellare TaxID=395010 RepID=A0ABR0EXP0_ZASCE|nr:hypothetical protein PRZ48_000002 [Zasmidium cellare]